MLVMEPVLALVALNHELIEIFGGMGLLAVTIGVEVVLVVVVPFVLVVLLLVQELAREWHPTVAAVTSKIKLRIELDHIVSFMAVIHAADAETVRFDVINELAVIWKSFLNY